MILELSDLGKVLAVACILFWVPMENFECHFISSLRLLNTMLRKRSQEVKIILLLVLSVAHCGVATVPAPGVGQDLFLKASSSQVYVAYYGMWGGK